MEKAFNLYFTDYSNSIFECPHIISIDGIIQDYIPEVARSNGNINEIKYTYNIFGVADYSKPMQYITITPKIYFDRKPDAISEYTPIGNVLHMQSSSHAGILYRQDFLYYRVFSSFDEALSKGLETKCIRFKEVERWKA